MRRVGLLTAAAACALVSGAANADFVFPNFTPAPPGLSLVGNAAPTVVGNALRLTNNSANQAGAAWFNTRQNVASGFTTTFRYQVSAGTSIPFATPSDTGADGVVFVIQNVDTAQIGAVGGGIGYAGIPNSLAVETDTFFNTNITIFGNLVASSNGDPNGNHVGIHSNGLNPNSDNITASLGNSILIPDLSDGNPHTIRVSYVPGTMSVYVDNLVTPALVTPVNLSTLLNLTNGEAYVGLTSATGQAAENHDVLDWSFASVPEPTTLGALALAALTLGRRRK